MKIERFEDIIAWQKAIELATMVYTHYEDSRDGSFRNQICRASVSVSNNIAEGFNRGSDKEFVRFLTIARSSCDEVKSMSYLAEKLRYMDETKRNMFINQCEEVSRLIFALSKAVKARS